MDGQPRADLHARTTRSDGTLTPTELVETAVAAHLAAVAITDHDTTAGIREAQAAASSLSLEVIPGIEISSRTGNREIHLLGLFIDPDAEALMNVGKRQRAWRLERAEVIVQRAIAQGLNISIDEVLETADGAPIGRPHLAQVLVNNGEVLAMQDAFDRYLGIGRTCHVPKRMLSTAEAIEAVHIAGGVSVVAHPGSSRVREKLLTALRDEGLDGVEVVHPRHRSGRRHQLRGLCKRLGLLPSGGSDYHGPGRGDAVLGVPGIPMDWCEGLRQRAGTHQTAKGVS
ncbi:MAG: PHP domain-containing protein [Acidobacteria bacterium]|nr:PHP domain-containing protein [Acidobacteriota bacterium]